MDKYIGFDIDSKKTMAYIMQEGKETDTQSLTNIAFLSIECQCSYSLVFICKSYH